MTIAQMMPKRRASMEKRTARKAISSKSTVPKGTSTSAWNINRGPLISATRSSCIALRPLRKDAAMRYPAVTTTMQPTPQRKPGTR